MGKIAAIKVAVSTRDQAKAGKVVIRAAPMVAAAAIRAGKVDSSTGSTADAAHRAISVPMSESLKR